MMDERTNVTCGVIRDLLPLYWILEHPDLLVSAGRGKTNGAGEDS